MDAKSIATEIAERLEVLDSIASATVDETGVVITVMTQGGTSYAIGVVETGDAEDNADEEGAEVKDVNGIDNR